MTRTEGAYLDGFRVISALLVVSIHTSPLESISPDADWLLTRVIARIAVPFFFMSTGYFPGKSWKTAGYGKDCGSFVSFIWRRFSYTCR